jgi:hypothetical protein
MLLGTRYLGSLLTLTNFIQVRQTIHLIIQTLLFLNMVQILLNVELLFS